MKSLTQEDRLDYLVEELCKDSGKYSILDIEKAERRRGLRALMNIRAPHAIADEFLRIQDAFLQQESIEKGIIRLEDIPTICRQYGSESGHQYADRISIWQGDITRLEVDGIVNAANSQMLGCFVPSHGCIDNAIHSSAGIQLREECYQYMKKQKVEISTYEEPTGSALVTGAFNLPSKYVIHTVGPIVGKQLTEELKEDLHSCYKSCMVAAMENGIRSIAFCCISTGEFHFPNDAAAKIAVEEVEKVLNNYGNKFDRVIFNVFKDHDREIYEKLLLGGI